MYTMVYIKIHKGEFGVLWYNVVNFSYSPKNTMVYMVHFWTWTKSYWCTWCIFGLRRIATGVHCTWCIFGLGGIATAVLGAFLDFDGKLLVYMVHFRTWTDSYWCTWYVFGLKEKASGTLGRFLDFDGKLLVHLVNFRK